ncbi:MAG: hypothetical protein AABX85_03765 [Nanoarchaeota archaeon]
MKELIENALEFFESGQDNVKKKRWNAAVSDFFKAISNFCDYLIYEEIKILPKNHNERFNILKKYFKEVYEKILKLFEIYRNSYNLRLTREDAIAIEEYAKELKKYIKN